MTALLMCLVGTDGLNAQVRTAPLIVRVVDAHTGAQVVNAEVSIGDIRRATRSNALGEARLLDVSSGRHTIRVRAFGYAPSEIPHVVSGDSIGPVFFLHRVPAALDTVRVSDSSVPARLREFEFRRSNHTGGYFITQDVLATNGITLEEVVARKIPGVSAQRAIDGAVHVYSRRGPCQVAVFFNGVRLLDGNAGIVPLSELAGVEYYSPGFAPAQYRVAAPLALRKGQSGGASACGVMLLWTR